MSGGQLVFVFMVGFGALAFIGLCLAVAWARRKNHEKEPERLLALAELEKARAIPDPVWTKTTKKERI